jgi:hypothetical protein
MNLYSDNHPETSLKNTGYKNSKIALQTIKLISKRSLKYQYDVINTMINRAKYHQYKTKEMLDAIKIFNKWLKKYKNQDKKLYPWLSINIIKKYLQLAKINNINTFFYKYYKKINSPYKLQYISLKNNLFVKSKFYNMDLWSYRIYIINKYKNSKLYNINGTITKKHLIMILHAYSPDKILYNN